MSGMRTITGPGERRPFAEGVQLPKWGGSLSFRKARLREVGHLKRLYEDAWGNGIKISRTQLALSILSFPEGQIVGCENGSDTPVSMINIMLTVFDPKKGFKGHYSRVTAGRTFLTSLRPWVLSKILKLRKDLLPVAFCVSVAVPPQHKESGYAIETLNYAVRFSSVNGVVPAPYSAPRGLAKAKKKNPHLSISDYLHMTRPYNKPFEAYFAKIGVISPRISNAFNGKTIISRKLFEKYHSYGKDLVQNSIEACAFWKFMESADGAAFERSYGRKPTIEDFCILTGRMLMDPVIGMHVGNGARFIRDESGNITAVFADSRPEDRTALGYNIILTYIYHPSFGQPAMI